MTNQLDPIVIAIDGGGSKTDGVALDLDGHIIARDRKRGSSFQPDDLQHSVRVVDDLVTQLRTQSGGRPVLQTNIYLAGLDLPVEIAAFAAALEEKPWATGVGGRPVVVDNDLFALLRSGTEERNAVAVVCGTGINCIGIRADGEHARFTAWGNISGDWGGGWFLGEQALWHAARAMDGRGDPTLLTKSVPAHLGLPDVQAVIEAFHFGRLSTDRFATMAPLVMAAADAGDEVAGGILDRQADEIVALAVAALKRLDLLEQPVPVVLGGGVLASGNPRLLRGIEAGLASRAPEASAQLVRSRPILGAALLTLEAVDASPAALAAATAALEYTPAPTPTPTGQNPFHGVSVDRVPTGRK
ncbi:N-acetylglucosamine kinase [Parafrigoribacterium mesophilum]|uniref:N-acetylglucosamine kinase n=1 Tax=Parafrigoribacterium mesophilum TaxID=433646 RepID=UPI0031FC0B2C